MKINSSLPLKKTITVDDVKEQMRTAAQGYEELFLNEMVKAMRSTVSESGLVPVSGTEKYFREQMDFDRVKSWASKGGVGLQDMVYNQLIEKYGPRLGIEPQSAARAQSAGPKTLKDTPYMDLSQSKETAKIDGK